MLQILKRPKAEYRSLFALMLPMIIQNITTSSLALADTVMVGILGQDELSGLTQANTVFFIVQLFIFGVQSGGSVLISQYWGKKDIGAINRIMGASIYVAGAFTFVISLIIFFFPEAVMSLTTNDPVLIRLAAEYGKTVAFSYFINSIVLIYLGAQRNAENARVGMFVLAGSMVINIVLNWVLIFGHLGFPALGIRGAAIATFISRVAELVMVIIHILFIDKRLKIMPKLLLRPGIIIWRDYIKYATPVLLNETLWGFGYSMYAVIFGHMRNASDIVAAYSITGNVERFVMVVTFAVANSAAVIIGKTVGEGAKKEHVIKLGNWLLAISVITGLISAAMLTGIEAFALDSFVFRLFPLSPNAQKTVVIMLIIMAVRSVFKSYNTTCIVGVLRGGGDVKTGMYLDIFTMYLYAIPVGVAAAFLFDAPIAVVFSLIVSEDIAKAIMGMIKIRGGEWVRNITREKID